MSAHNSTEGTPSKILDNPGDMALLESALKEANMPTLMATLAHLSGDMTWVSGSLRASGPRGMDVNDDGGLSPEQSDRVRKAVLTLVEQAGNGTPMPVRPLKDAEILQIMSAQAGEPVGIEFLDLVREELGLLDRYPQTAHVVREREELDVLIIGAGLSGVCAGARLGQAGFNYRVVEKTASPGGTWSANVYPGAGVDTPSHLYSFSFEQVPTWSRYYAKSKEINAYVANVSEKYGVTARTSYSTTVTAATYHEESARWEVSLAHADGTTESVTVRVVISGIGQLNNPAIPNIPGAAEFKGRVMHTAEWSPDLDLSGKRVVCAGSGASAMQLVPVVAQEAGHLTVLQRSPQWATPNPNYLREVSDGFRFLCEHLPYYQQWYRVRLFWMFNDKIHRSLQIDSAWPHQNRSINQWNDRHREVFTQYIKEELGDRLDLLPAVLPDYPPFGKRILIDNGWYRALRRSNVELITQGLAGLTEDAVVTTDGREIPADVVVLSTGFQALRLLDSIDVRGKAGMALRTYWGDDDARAYMGIAIPNFPNFFCIYGPNTNLGHGGSIIFNTECQVRYVVDLLIKMDEAGVEAADCREDVCDNYNRKVDEAHNKMIWSHRGFSSWYRNAKGRVVTNSPWRLIDYWSMTREADLGDYHLTALRPDGRAAHGHVAAVNL